MHFDGLSAHSPAKIDLSHTRLQVYLHKNFFFRERKKSSRERLFILSREEKVALDSDQEHLTSPYSAIVESTMHESTSAQVSSSSVEADSSFAGNLWGKVLYISIIASFP